MIPPTQLTEAQEELRREGLRILARIIARHYLEHHGRYPEPGDAADASAKNHDRRLDAGPIGRGSDREDAR